MKYQFEIQARGDKAETAYRRVLEMLRDSATRALINLQEHLQKPEPTSLKPTRRSSGKTT